MSQLNEKINERRVIKRLSIAEKLQVIEDFKNGMKNKDLSEKYKVHHSAISRIVYNKDKILEHKKTIEKYGANKNVLRYSSVHDSLFEKCTFLWFSQKRALGEPVTGPVLQAKAKQFHASLNVDSNFSASNGWLTRFKKRHGIQCLNIKGEKRQCVFGDELKALLNSNNNTDSITVRIPGCGEMSLKEVENWIDKDQYEPPYNVFNDSQLIEIAKGGIEGSDSEEEWLNSNNNKDSDEESPNLPPPSLDEVLQSILQIRRWSRGNKIVTVEENRCLDSLMEKMVQLKNKYFVN